MRRILKLFLFTTLTLAILGAVTYSFRNELKQSVLVVRAKLDWRYDAHKELLMPHFDEAFYQKTYAEDLKKTGMNPLDHFLTFSGMVLWEKEFNPNAYFPTHLYRDYLWERERSWFSVPFMQYLKHAYPTVDAGDPEIQVYCAKGEETRAWMACEELMRRGGYQVVLTLDPEFSEPPIIFKKQLDRGMAYEIAPQHVSFYQCVFLQDDTFWQEDARRVLTTLEDVQEPIYIYEHKSGIKFLLHKVYRFLKWKQRGKINPLMLNVAKYANEPIEFSDIDRHIPAFQEKMKALAPGFDLMMISTELSGVDHARILPGYLYSHDNGVAINPSKKFALSYMLSLGGKGFKNYKDRGTMIYRFRKEIWDRQDQVTAVPVDFYISRRDIDKFPKDLRNRVIPKAGKQVIYNAQFVVAIENVKQPHYMSEKLLDCFLNLSIPIYIGMPNICDYFDVRGMLIAKTPDDIVRIANSLTPQTFKEMLPYLKKNRQRALKYLNYQQKLVDEFVDSFLEKRSEA